MDKLLFVVLCYVLNSTVILSIKQTQWGVAFTHGPDPQHYCTVQYYNIELNVESGAHDIPESGHCSQWSRTSHVSFNHRWHINNSQFLRHDYLLGSIHIVHNYIREEMTPISQLLPRINSFRLANTTQLTVSSFHCIVSHSDWNKSAEYSSGSRVRPFKVHSLRYATLRPIKSLLLASPTTNAAHNTTPARCPAQSVRTKRGGWRAGEQ